MAELPQRAQVVIVGGGVIGTSVAYHLTKLGWTDVLLLEQGRLSSGTTWHAAGLVGQLRASESGTRLVQYSTALYERLEAETGLSTGYRRCGGVTVARSQDRMTQLRRTAANADAYGLDCELLTPAQALDRFPVIATEDLAGAIWLPDDGRADPTDLTQALAKGARMGGATIVEKVRVLDVLVTDGTAVGVRTDQGDVEAEVVVNCAGQWAKQVGAMAGVNVPLHSAEHFYVVTEPFAGIVPGLPILRDPDGYTYFKEETGGLVVGGFEPEAKPWVSPDEIPYPFEFQLLEEDWEHFSFLMDQAILRIPVLAETGVRKFYNGPESFTPDNQFLLGAAPEVRNFYVGAGFNSVGIASAGGAGRALAEWIVGGEAPSDLTAVDIRRFAPFNGDNGWLRERVGEVLGLHYEIPWPNREMSSARPLRTSPAYDATAGAGAVFGTKMGWERPLVFAPSDAIPALGYTWGKPVWLEWSSAEHRNTRENVTVFDQTSFSKYRVTGPDAEAALQWLCTGDVAVEPGRTVYTGILNSRGTYESDVTVTRISAEEYFVVSSAATTERDQDHVRRNLPAGSRTVIADVTDDYAVFGVMGPRSRDLLSRLTEADLVDFPFGTSREITLAGTTLRATRITYVGELGWELYVPSAVASDVYDALMKHGAGLGVMPGGYYAIDSLRLEKGYRAFPRDINPDLNPLEAGLLFTCKLGTDLDFLGRAALGRARTEGARRRLVSFALEDPDPMLWGGELVLREGRPAGQVTSAAWGATVGAAVGLALLWDFEDGEFEVNVGGRIYPIRTSRRPLVDPDGVAVKQ
ncbi:GcvT family protein [Nocardioides marmorisolisilvae]|uniref:FAD-dependent oxidoreductase n=1 Tax=Nocardioides marmorisolisilvae TaxID=1542737 RepID=A0A3N0DZU9_9ACTN|nr:FAD-dependent oxidoreductase [Nocardioides marmorisolisilvae]RNL81132.1 FAD-dependent oxidoreductase [Nocardioides marmorisolisilvae]